MKIGSPEGQSAWPASPDWDKFGYLPPPDEQLNGLHEGSQGSATPRLEELPNLFQFAWLSIRPRGSRFGQNAMRRFFVNSPKTLNYHAKRQNLQLQLHETSSLFVEY